MCYRCLVTQTTFQTVPTFSRKTLEQRAFVDGQFVSIKQLENENNLISWSYHRGAESLTDRSEYVKLRVASQEIKDCVPNFIHLPFKKSKDILLKHMTSLKETKVDLEQFDFLDVLPKDILIDYFSSLNTITDYVKERFPKPPNHDILRNMSVVLSDIASRDLKICVPDESFQDKTLEPYWHTLESMKVKNSVQYDIFSSKTGKIYTAKNSFPVNIKKEFRQYVKPNNDYFLELDFNAFDLRVFLGLLGKEQPNEDIHEFNIREIWNGKLDKKQAKTNIFAWLYSNSHDDRIEKVYDKTILLDKFYGSGIITNMYDLNIECDQFHALNYLIQSTGSQIFNEQVYKLYKLIKSFDHCLSKLVLINQDSVLIDVKESDQLPIKDLIDAFKKTRLGDFKVNVKTGPNWYDLQEFDQCSLSQ